MDRNNVIPCGAAILVDVEGSLSEDHEPASPMVRPR